MASAFMHFLYACLSSKRVCGNISFLCHCKHLVGRAQHAIWDSHHYSIFGSPKLSSILKNRTVQFPKSECFSLGFILSSSFYFPVLLLPGLLFSAVWVVVPTLQHPAGKTIFMKPLKSLSHRAAARLDPHLVLCSSFFPSHSLVYGSSPLKDF